MAYSRYNRLDNQAPAQTQLKADDVSVGRSAHDFSTIHSGNAFIGALIPIDCFDVVPNEDIDLSLTPLLEFRNPTTRQLLNGFRVFFHAYYNKLEHLWEGAKNWLDNGRSGKLSLTRPNLVYHMHDDSHQSRDVIVNACTPMSLLNYLGLPAEAIQKNTDTTSQADVLRSPLRQFECAVADDTTFAHSLAFDKLADSPDYFPADCAFAYQKNWRDFYCNKNLLQNNKYWFPDNEDHFILSYSCTNAVCLNYENEDFSKDGVSKKAHQAENLVGYLLGAAHADSKTPEPNSPDTVNWQSSSVYSYPNLSGLKFRQFRGDRFTTALPFPDLIRGDIPVLSSTQEALAQVRANLYDGSSHKIASEAVPHYNNPVDSPTYVTFEKVSVNNAQFVPGKNYSDVSYATDFHVSLGSLGVTMSDIYTLETLTAFKRRMGMTNGDYNEMIKAQYGVNPHSEDRTATYIGGFYQDFAMNSVTQTSESGSTPLGTKAGQGVSSGSGTIGHFHTPDFGWIQIYMSIVPDVMYTQGIPRQFSKRSNLEMYFPIFNNLPAQAILNKELYVSGTPATDNDVFAYEDRYAEYKSRGNRVSGFMSLSHAVAAFDSARVMARRFSSTPALNSLFVTMVPENVDMEVFSVVDEPPFDFSVGISCRRVFPGPYTAIEGSLSSPALVRG